MAVMTDIRKTVSQYPPMMAVVGATDLAVAQVRKAAANVPTIQAEVETRVTKVQAEVEDRVNKVQAEVESRVTKVQEEVEKTFASIDPAAVRDYLTKNLEPKHLQAQAQQVPALAVARALEVAGRVEGVYEGLAARGKKLVDAIESQKATQDLLAQGKSTLSRTRAAVTTARHAVDETASAAMGVVTAGRKGGAEVVGEVEKAVAETEKAVVGTVEETGKATRTAAKKTATTARKRAVSTRSAAKGVATSARKTAAKAVDAVEAAAEKVGE